MASWDSQSAIMETTPGSFSSTSTLGFRAPSSMLACSNRLAAATKRSTSGTRTTNCTVTIRHLLLPLKPEACAPAAQAKGLVSDVGGIS